MTKKGKSIGKMDQWIKVLLLSQRNGVQALESTWKERADSHELSSDSIYAMRYMHVPCKSINKT